MVGAISSNDAMGECHPGIYKLPECEGLHRDLIYTRLVAHGFGW